ncbi:hypothetical protein ACQP0C_18605 [Nocardia sp. CA-129566]|uniref:hypothetical protein n=1 Tax=Nocardia sp. CA-129566 TaxID=3239976 RepID=UPI003D96B6FF
MTRHPPDAVPARLATRRVPDGHRRGLVAGEPKGRRGIGAAVTRVALWIRLSIDEA